MVVDPVAAPAISTAGDEIVLDRHDLNTRAFAGNFLCCGLDRSTSSSSSDLFVSLRRCSPRSIVKPGPTFFVSAGPAIVAVGAGASGVGVIDMSLSSSHDVRSRTNDRESGEGDIQRVNPCVDLVKKERLTGAPLISFDVRHFPSTPARSTHPAVLAKDVGRFALTAEGVELYTQTARLARDPSSRRDLHS